VVPHLAHGGGDGWNSSGTIWLPDFQARAQLVSLPPGAWHMALADDVSDISIITQDLSGYRTDGPKPATPKLGGGLSDTFPHLADPLRGGG
jgi:hypothetical protein